MVSLWFSYESSGERTKEWQVSNSEGQVPAMKAMPELLRCEAKRVEGPVVSMGKKAELFVHGIVNHVNHVI